jgi:hypothetical protein
MPASVLEVAAVINDATAKGGCATPIPDRPRARATFKVPNRAASP